MNEELAKCTVEAGNKLKESYNSILSEQKNYFLKLKNGYGSRAGWGENTQFAFDEDYILDVNISSGAKANEIRFSTREIEHEKLDAIKNWLINDLKVLEKEFSEQMMFDMSFEVEINLNGRNIKIINHKDIYDRIRRLLAES